MHIENEPLEIVTFGEQEYDEVIEEYEEEILVQEDVPELPVTEFADTAPAQGKPWCITPIFNDHWIYIWCAFTLLVFYGNYLQKYIYLWVLLVHVE